jgi:uncharacterized C2H2 Zn-finger protein
MREPDLIIKCPECFVTFPYVAETDDYSEQISGLEGDYFITCPNCDFEEVTVNVDYIPYFSSKHSVRE